MLDPLPRDLDIAEGPHTAGALIVGNPVGDDVAAVIFELHIALRGDGFIVVVVDQLVGRQEKLRFGIAFAASW